MNTPNSNLVRRTLVVLLVAAILTQIASPATLAAWTPKDWEPQTDQLRESANQDSATLT